MEPTNKLTDEARRTQNEVKSHNDTLAYVNKLTDVKELKKRKVWWDVLTYLCPAEFEYALNKATHWAYILHDKDVDENGELKEAHYHILLHYDNSRTGFAVLKDFVGRQNTRVQVPKPDEVTCYEYLTHTNDPDKFQYSKENIISHNPVFWEHFLPCIRDRNDTDFIEDLLTENDIDIVYMARKYGRDFMKNFRSYLDFRHKVKPSKIFNESHLY